MPLTKNEISAAYDEFIRIKKNSSRFSSYDYCYNYFHSFSDKRDLASAENLEKSCLHLGFYLASWGMLRASGFLSKESLTFYKGIVEWLAKECPKEAWLIDVHNYNRNDDLLIHIYNDLCRFIPEENRKITLATKMMLGIMGNTPAFDSYFVNTFKNHYGERSKFHSFNKTALEALYEFYNENNQLIDQLCGECYTAQFPTGAPTNFHYTKAKIIDMIGFGYSYKKNGKRAVPGSQ
jgi:hypothetical protein